MRFRKASLLGIAATVLAGCGSSGAPSSPTPGAGTGSTTIDLNGTWVETGGGTRTWTLAQGGIQVSGPASFAYDNSPLFGVVSGTGGLLGATVLGGFRFSETFESLDIPSKGPRNDCYIDTDGQMTVSGSTMTGNLTETAGCAGVRVGQVTRTLTMRRR